MDYTKWSFVNLIKHFSLFIAQASYLAMQWNQRSMNEYNIVFLFLSISNEDSGFSVVIMKLLVWYTNNTGQEGKFPSILLGSWAVLITKLISDRLTQEKNKFNFVGMGAPANYEAHGQSSNWGLNDMPSWAKEKRKEICLFQGEKAIPRKMRRQMFVKQMCSMPCKEVFLM